MSLIENIITLKKKYPNIWKYLKPILEGEKESPFVVKEARNGLPTLVYEKDGTTTAIHSLYDPRHEAQVFTRKLRESDLSKHNHVFFYGIGLGYHIEEFMKEHPDMFFSIFEPKPEAFCQFMKNRSFDDLPLRRLKSLYVLFDPDATEEYTYDFFNRYHDKPFFVTLPAYERLFKEEFDAFKPFFTGSISYVMSNRYTLLAFEKRWTFNSMLNFVYNLYFKNILNHEEDLFKNKPAILVAAGPSLEDEYENLRRIRKEGTAYIFCVGSAIKGLVKNGIEPHGAITMDPGEPTQYTFTDVIEKKITTIPHIYGSSVGFETLRTYPGPQMFMTLDRDTISPYFLKYKDDTPLGLVNDAPTVAITSLQLLCQLGCNPVILVGQNLGFRNNQNYAKGIEYEKIGVWEKRDHMATDRELAQKEVALDVYGNEMQTSTMYNLFRRSMEHVMTMFPEINFINTTKGGASIKGSTFTELSKLMKKRLKKRVAEEDWMEHVKPGDYNIEYLLAQKKRMDRSLVLLKRRLSEMETILVNLNKHIAFRNNRLFQEDFKTLDKTFKGIIKNSFYRTFLSPLNMLETAIFGNDMALVHAEILHAERAQHVVDNFGRYVKQCNFDVTHITDVLYPYMVANISIYQDWLKEQATKSTAIPEIEVIDIDKTFLQPEEDLI